MKNLSFKASEAGSIGIELEMQIINPKSFDLVSRSPVLLKSISRSDYEKNLKPEVTQSMIELNSNVHLSIDTLLLETETIHALLIELAEQHNVLLCGGGTHPFEKWTAQKVFPAKRYKTLTEQYRYLSKHSTVFGQHIHIGCENTDDAMYLTHALGHYVPHFFALSASSPYYQGVDTGFQSCRSTLFNSFPSSGVIPFFETWEHFSEYFYKMKNLKIIHSMKDLYWDVRPKPEFGTVEVRVCDTPLVMKKAVYLAAFLQTLARYLLAERPIKISKEMYYIYNYNRFQGARYGFEGELVDTTSAKRYIIKDDLITTLNLLEKYANDLGNKLYLDKIRDIVTNNKTDANLLRNIRSQVGSLEEVVREQCALWQKDVF